MTADPTLSTMSPADRHREVAGRFADLIAGTTDWDAPTPVAEWTARDIVRHLIDWLPGVLGLGTDVTLVPTTSVDRDPAAAWRERSEDVQAVLDDSLTAEAPFRSPMFGDLTVAELLDRFYTADIFMHSWDLARASGQPSDLDEEWAAGMLEGMSGMESMIRESGQFGMRQPVAGDAPVTDRLIAFIGRDPAWRPPSAP